MKEVKPIPAKDISAEVLDLLRHIRDQVDKLCSLPPEVLGSSSQEIHNHHRPTTWVESALKVQREFAMEDSTHGLEEVFEKLSDYDTQKNILESKSISRRIAAQKPKKGGKE